MIIGAVLGVILAIVVIIAACYLLVPALRQRERSARRTREENARESVESMVLTERKTADIDLSEESILSRMEAIESRSASRDLKLSERELYFLALESLIFGEGAD